MAITDVPAFAHMTDADIENLAVELDAVRRAIEDSRGERDARYIRRTIAAQRALEVAGRVMLAASAKRSACWAGAATPHDEEWISGSSGRVDRPRPFRDDKPIEKRFRSILPRPAAVREGSRTERRGSTRTLAGQALEECCDTRTTGSDSAEIAQLVCRWSVA